MLLYIVVALVKLFVFHGCTIDVFLRYVRIKKFIIIIIIIIIIMIIIIHVYISLTKTVIIIFNSCCRLENVEYLLAIFLTN